MVIDYERLRADLIDCFGSAMFASFPFAIVDLSSVELATPDELVLIAQNYKWDLTNYQIEEKEDNTKSL